MKNYIPTILAVLLGVAAVLAVRRMMPKDAAQLKDNISVVALTRDMAAGDTIQQEDLKRISGSAADVHWNAIPWQKKDVLVGQVMGSAVRGGEYLLRSDVQKEAAVSSIVGEKEWAVSFAPRNMQFASFVEPGDEVAVIGTFNFERSVPSANLSEAPKVESKEATMVLFPRVTVLKKTGDGTGGELVVALPPDEAQMLLAAQRQAVALYVALRNREDESFVNRADAGMIDETSFGSMLNGIPTAQIKLVPGNRSLVSGDELAPAR